MSSCLRWDTRWGFGRRGDQPGMRMSLHLRGSFKAGLPVDLTYAKTGQIPLRPEQGTSGNAETLSRCGPSSQEITMTDPPDDHRESVRGGPLEHDRHIVNGSMLALAAFAVVAVGIAWYAMTKNDRSRVVSVKPPAVQQSVPTPRPVMAAGNPRCRRRIRPPNRELKMPDYDDRTVRRRAQPPSLGSSSGRSSS